MKNYHDFQLTSNITVGQLNEWLSSQSDDSKENMLKFIHHRFNNRYVKHLKQIDSGFLKMAVSCLMIETIESFRQGKKDTKGKSAKMFEDFFRTEKAIFPGFEEIHSDFYTSIRCGILHQAETRNGWRILRREVLLDKKKKTINATKFVVAVEKSLEQYINNLKSSDLSSSIWKNALLKLKYISENCKTIEI
jgi:hypothetical protein